MSDIEIGYRIVEFKNGRVYSLFHGTKSSREIKLDEWNDAEQKPVKDGKNGKLYLSGWHFMKEEKLAEYFLKNRFKIKKNRFVIKCYVRGNIRPKHTNKTYRYHSYLANQIMIKSEDLPLTEL